MNSWRGAARLITGAFHAFTNGLTSSMPAPGDKNVDMLIGGQAVIEGVMMRSPSRVAVAVRRSDGTRAFMERPFSSITRRVKALGLPIVRGAVSLFETLYLGITALNFSADEAVRDEEATPWLTGRFSSSTNKTSTPSTG